jgi:hypothetical protein
MILCLSCKGGKVEYATASAPINVRTITIDNTSTDRVVSDSLQFGRMRSGEIITKTVRIENRSDQPILLTHHQVSCGCLKVQYDRRPISAGESCDVSIEFDSRTMYGLQLKNLILYLAEKDNPIKIFVEAEVE